MTRLALAVAVTALAAAVAGCSVGFHVGSNEIDRKKAEALVRRVADTGRIRLAKATCPGGVKEKKGATFQCRLLYADGTTGTITIHQLDGSGHVRTSGRDIRIDAK